MQHITLVKTFPPSATIAHIYEHLYYDTLIQLMANHKLISRLDYYITAKTYIPGLVYINIELYTPQGRNIANKLDNQHINLDDSAVAVALLQVMAEEKSTIRGSANIFEVLSKLDKKPWLNLDHLDFIDLREEHNNKLLANMDTVLKTKNLEVSLKLQAATTNDLTPLFAVISHILLANLENSLMDIYGYYAFDESTKSNKLTSVLRASQEHRPRLTDELDTCKETITQLLKIRFVERLVQTLNIIEKGDPRPDELQIYDTTHILVGKKGWRNLATENNIRVVLQNMVLVLTYGEEKQQVQLAKIAKQ